MPMNPRTRELAEIVWRYHHVNHSLANADAILVLCSHDVAVAERGAQLFLDGWAPILIYSGGLGAITKQMWTTPEADRFAAIAIEIRTPSSSCRSRTWNGEAMRRSARCGLTSR